MSPFDQLLFALADRHTWLALLLVVLLGCYARLAYDRQARERLRDEADRANVAVPLTAPAHEESAGR